MSPRPTLGLWWTVVALGLAGATTCCASPADALQHHRIEIRDAVFTPAELEVSVGDTVTWTNNDDVPHTATSPRWDSRRLDPGDSWTMVVGESGEVGYACLYHPGMTARLVSS